MKCPGCGLYHPPQYEQCISCGTSLGADDDGQPPAAQVSSVAVQTDPRPEETGAHHHLRRSKVKKEGHQSAIPTFIGLAVAFIILFVSAGATFFFLTKPGDDELLLRDAVKQLENGQYAFAVTTLEKVSAMRPKDARVYLTLARAYVGVDQVDKAWACISQAQQLGAGVVSEPELASELANYYRQRSQYDKAIELLRPLAQANVPGKKAELADLDALWGDEAIRDGDFDKALRCWEEVRDLREGTRYMESDARLATIYGKLSNKLIAEKNDTQALAYLAKLNTIAENATTYERSAEIYERRGDLEMAIDQLRHASQLPSKSATVERRLAALMARRGKELLDQGNTQAGYGYLQEARALDPLNVLPTVTARNVSVTVEGGSQFPRISGEVWNAGMNPVKLMSLKVELWNPTTQKVLWEREQKIIDEFVPPLGPAESKPFDMMAAVGVKADGQTEFRLYLDGGLYKSYPIGGSSAATTGKVGSPERTPPVAAPEVLPPVSRPAVAPPLAPPIPQPAPPATPETPAAPPLRAPIQPDGQRAKPGAEGEEHTMKELEF